MNYYILRFNSKLQEWYYQSSFESYDALLEYLAKVDSSSCINEKLNDNFYLFKHWRQRDGYLDNINMNFNDTVAYPEWDGENYYSQKYLRHIMFVDEDERIIDVRKDIPKINAIRKSMANQKYRRKYPEFEFRRGPVPGTFREPWGNYLGKRYRPLAYRHIGYGKLVREFKSEEFKEFGRKSRTQCSEWDYMESVISDYRSKSWKDNTRYKKQWMKNLK